MTSSRRDRLLVDRFEWVLLAALSALALSVLAGLLLRTIVKGGYVTGGDGFLVVDPLQYLNWLRQSGNHIAAANLYDFAPLRYGFVHPGNLASGIANRLGLGVVASYALFKPVAVASLFVGVGLLVHRHLGRRSDRRLALAVALFFCAPTAAIGGWTLDHSSNAKISLDFAGGELWTGSYLWGYVFTAIAVGLVPVGLLAYERGRCGRNRRSLVIAATCALFAGWLQPWQGATLICVVVLTELQRLRSKDRTGAAAVGDLAPIVLAGLLPLVYYLLLSRLDPAWELAGTANQIDRWPLWILIVTILPLAAPAALAYRRGNWGDFGSVALRVWPLVGLVIYFAPIGTFPFHALQGVQYPLAVLAVISWRSWLGGRKLPVVSAIVAALLLIVPGTIYRVDQIRNAVNFGVQPFFLTDDEHAALEFLDTSSGSGGVVTENYLATVIPAYTGRQTFLGAGSWTPNFDLRRDLLAELFAGQLGARSARQLLVRPGAGYLLDTCRANPKFFEDVSQFTTVVWKRGCVTVLRIEGAPPLGGKQPALPPLNGPPPK